MKRALPLLFLLLITLGSSIVAAAACPDFVILPDGRECTLTGVSTTGSCYYKCTGGGELQ